MQLCPIAGCDKNVAGYQASNLLLDFEQIASMGIHRLKRVAPGPNDLAGGFYGIRDARHDARELRNQDVNITVGPGEVKGPIRGVTQKNKICRKQ